MALGEDVSVLREGCRDLCVPVGAEAVLAFVGLSQRHLQKALGGARARRRDEEGTQLVIPNLAAGRRNEGLGFSLRRTRKSLYALDDDEAVACCAKKSDSRGVS